MRYPLLTMLAAACALASCGPGNGLTMGRVSGVVTYKGEPVEFGDILFVPDESGGNQGVPSMGKIGKDGRYTMSTQDPGDGVIAGRHKVGIRVLDPEPVSKTEAPAPDPETASGKELMNARLQQRKMLAQDRRKNRAREDAPTVSFNGKVHRFLVPNSLANPETSGLKVEVSTGSNRIDFAIAADGSVAVNK
jgi:hypothetical protein